LTTFFFIANFFSTLTFILPTHPPSYYTNLNFSPTY
jgi:hypothetical protein